jgi:hypothetical protein
MLLDYILVSQSVLTPHLVRDRDSINPSLISGAEINNQTGIYLSISDLHH